MIFALHSRSLFTITSFGNRLPACLASMALMCSLLYSSWCQSFSLDPLSGVGDPLRFSLWYRRKTELVEIGINNPNGTPLYRTVNTCVEFNDSYIDSQWRTARAFAIIAPIWGGLLTIYLWFAPLLFFGTPSLWKSVAFQYSTLVTLFQGLTFMVWKSRMCSHEFTMNLGSFQYEAGCAWDEGSTANVFSISLWFLTGIAMMIVGAPVRPPRPPPETQAVTYQTTVNADGTITASEDKVVKGTAVRP